MKLGCSSTSAHWQSIGSFNFELEVRVPRQPDGQLEVPCRPRNGRFGSARPGAAAATAATATAASDRGWVTVAPAATSL
jgi:hypothetical protein